MHVYNGRLTLRLYPRERENPTAFYKARVLRERADGPSLSEGRAARPHVKLADVPEEPPATNLGLRLFHRAYAGISDVVRLRLHRSRAADRDGVWTVKKSAAQICGAWRRRERPPTRGRRARRAVAVDCGATYVDPEGTQFVNDPLRPPSRILGGQPDDEDAGLGSDAGAAGPPRVRLRQRQ